MLTISSKCVLNQALVVPERTMLELAPSCRAAEPFALARAKLSLVGKLPEQLLLPRLDRIGP
jgi:hypothetical protein